MAAGKNDVIKLLPPLTLCEAEARSFLGALDAVLADCHGAASRTGESCATSPPPPASPIDTRAPGGRPHGGSRHGPSIRPAARSASSRAPPVIGGRLAQRLVAEGYQVRCLARSSSDTSLLDSLDVEISVGDLTSARSLTRATQGCRYVFHCGARVSDWATAEEITRINVQGTRNVLDAAVNASVQRVIHFSTTDIYG